MEAAQGAAVAVPEREEEEVGEREDERKQEVHCNTIKPQPEVNWF